MNLVRSASSALLLLLTPDTVTAASWFVAPDGNDSGPGSRREPFATLQRAVEASRATPAKKNQKITLSAGVYYSTRVDLDPQDSGLTIRTRGDSEAVLVGGQPLSGFRPNGEQFWAADLPDAADLDFRLLVINNRLVPRARYPETGTLKHLSEFKVPWMGTYGGGWKRKPTNAELTTMLAKPHELGSHFEVSNAELTIYHEWDESMVGVKSFETTTGRLVFKSPTGHPPGAFGNQNFVIWNTRDGMTKPGQWYLDHSRRKVVYWPLASEIPEHLQAIIPTCTEILSIRGSAQKPVRNLVIRGVTLMVNNTPLKSGGFGAYEFSGALNASYIKNCRFANLKVRHVAGQGIKISHGELCEISSCMVAETGAGGILAQGSNLLVERNHLGNLGRIYPSGIALTCTGNKNVVTGNYIHDTPYVGLTCSGTEARIENNRVERVMQELHDGAGIYLGGTNHLIRGNVCLRIGNSTTDRRHAYYMDEHVRDSRLEGNLALECPSPLHNHLATNNIIVNNIFIQHGDARIAFYRCADHQLERNLVWAQGRIEVFRPEAVSRWTNNLFYSASGVVLGYPVDNYTAGNPKPLEVQGVQHRPSPVLIVLDEGKVDWGRETRIADLGIRPLDLRSAGRGAAK